MEEFPVNLPGNSHASKIAAPNTEESAEPTTGDDKKVESVVTGKVTRRKKTLGTRFKEHFLTEGESFLDHLVNAVIIPKGKEIILSVVDQAGDAVKEGFAEALFPGRATRPSTTRLSSFGTRINYNNVSRTPPPGARPTGMPPRYTPTVRRSNVVEDIVLELREDVDMVLDQLRGVIERHGHCTLGDLYSLVDITPRNTDEEWGWTNLDKAGWRKVEDGYLVVVPRPIPIDNGR
uniref:Helix-turn-helix DNA binding domain protein n=1 Tax=Streptomyces phage Scarif TaxID=3158858 RepID=A0AAU7GXA7_9CAUD